MIKFAKAFHESQGQLTITRLRQRFGAAEGLNVAVNGSCEVINGPSRKLDGDGEAYLIALNCSPPPDGCCQLDTQLLLR